MDILVEIDFRKALKNLNVHRNKFNAYSSIYSIFFN